LFELRRCDAVSYLGTLFRNRRVERGLTTGQLARLVGYQNLSRGSNRIHKFESGGKIAPDLLARLSSALEVTPDEIRRPLSEDYREWLDWANEPMRPYAVIRHLACGYQRIELPDDALDLEAAEAFAARLARGRNRMVCLVLNRRLSVGFDATGNESQRREATPEMPCEPYVEIGGRRCLFNLSGDASIRPVDPPDE
jgi:transcriptional regulator with XRE-family HTH domain